MKIIFTLAGYDNGVYFCSSIFFELDEFAENTIVGFTFDKNSFIENKKTHRYSYTHKLNQMTLNLFIYLINLSLKDYCDITIYFTTLDIILDISGFSLGCFIFNNLSLVKNLTTTEGLYLRKTDIT
ncbi:MAG: hypothetical protein ACK5LT_06895 [Lachnospirales bacterium]